MLVAFNGIIIASQRTKRSMKETVRTLRPNIIVL